MAFRHDDGLYAGKWELEGAIVRETAKARLWDFGEFQWWLPKARVHCVPLGRGDGRHSVYLPDWLYQAKVNEMRARHKEGANA